jgi:hypothetical protein
VGEVSFRSKGDIEQRTEHVRFGLNNGRNIEPERLSTTGADLFA